MDAQRQATVVLTQPASGGVALRVEADGSFVLAEQLGTKALALGQVLVGRMDVIGLEDWVDRSDGEQRFAVFIQAYGLSWEAVRAELA